MKEIGRLFLLLFNCLLQWYLLLFSNSWFSREKCKSVYKIQIDQANITELLHIYSQCEIFYTLGFDPKLRIFFLFWRLPLMKNKYNWRVGWRIMTYEDITMKSNEFIHLRLFNLKKINIAIWDNLYNIKSLNQ